MLFLKLMLNKKIFHKRRDENGTWNSKNLHKEIQVAATCVRVPVLRSHSESITVTFEDSVDVDIDEVTEALERFENCRSNWWI